MAGTAYELCDAVLAGNADRVRTLLKWGVNASTYHRCERDFWDASITDYTWVPVLVLAAKAGRADLVSALLEHGADVDATAYYEAEIHITRDDLYEYPVTNALAIAARKGYTDVVEALIEAGADVKYVIGITKPHDVTNGAGHTTPLKQAERGHHQDIINILKAQGA